MFINYFSKNQKVVKNCNEILYSLFSTTTKLVAKVTSFTPNKAYQPLITAEGIRDYAVGKIFADGKLIATRVYLLAQKITENELIKQVYPIGNFVTTKALLLGQKITDGSLVTTEIAKNIDTSKFIATKICLVGYTIADYIPYALDFVDDLKNIQADSTHHITGQFLAPDRIEYYSIIGKILDTSSE